MVVWLVILGIVALALAAAALMDVRNKRMGITIDPQAIRERRLEQKREVRRAISPLSRKLHDDRDRDGRP